MVVKPGHPRLWLTGQRIAELRAAPKRLEWTRLLTNCEDGLHKAAAGIPLTKNGLPAHYDSPLNYALVYRVTGLWAYAEHAIKLIEIYMALGTYDAMTKIGTTSPHGFGARIVLPETAVTYDWLFDYLPATTKKRWADQLMAWADWCWLETNPAKGVPPLKNPDTWGQNNPGDNFYVGFLTGTLMAALAVYGEHPRAPAHLDLGMQKLGALVDYLAKYGEGGVSLEGTNYGSWMRHAMLFAALKTATDYGADMSHFFGDVARSRWHLTAPDRKHLAPLGGQPVGADAPITEDHTIAPLVALSHADTGTQMIAKSFLDSVTFTRKKANSWAPALWYRNEVKAISPAQQPLVYHAPGSGYVSMRSSWATDATWVVFNCGPVKESHQSYAAGEFMLWARGQWLTGPARLWGLGGEMLPSEFANVILVGKDEKGRWRGQPGQVQQQALPKDDMRILSEEPAFYGGIVKGEAGRAYDYYRLAQVWPVLESWVREVYYTASDQKITLIDTIRKVNPADEILWQLHCKAAPWIEGREYGILGTGVTLRGRCSLQQIDFKGPLTQAAPVLSVGQVMKGKAGALSSHRLEVLAPGGAKEVVLTNTLEIV